MGLFWTFWLENMFPVEVQKTQHTIKKYEYHVKVVISLIQKSKGFYLVGLNL